MFLQKFVSQRMEQFRLSMMKGNERLSKWDRPEEDQSLKERLMLELALLHLKGCCSSPEQWVGATRAGWIQWVRSGFRRYEVTRPSQLKVCFRGLLRVFADLAGYYRIRLHLKNSSTRKQKSAEMSTENIPASTEAWREVFPYKGLPREKQDRVRYALAKGLKSPRGKEITSFLTENLRASSQKGENF